MSPVTTTLRETSAPEETEAAGEELGRRLRKGDLVLLKGELGAGKTTFVRGMVDSPTFQLVRIYPGRLQLAHVDLYRIEHSTELADVGIDELADAGAVVVEWGDRIEVPDAALIEIEHLGGDRRRIRTERDLRH